MPYLRTVLIALLCVLPVMPVAAQEQASGLTMTLRPGYAGAYRLGEWFPITVDVANDGRDIRVCWSGVFRDGKTNRCSDAPSICRAVRGSA